jgi:two-component system response regulator AtoC
MSATTLKLPPLRERKEDLRRLVQYFIGKYSDDLCKEVSGIDAAAFALIEQYEWPGNVRELQNIIEHAVLVSDAPILKMEHLPKFCVSG